MSTNRALRDVNRVPTLIGISSSDDTTIIEAFLDPVTHRLYVDAKCSSPTGYSSVTSGNATNNTSGTAVQLPSNSCSMVTIYVPTGNTSSQVAIGDSSVKAASGSEKGVILISGSSKDFYVSNTNLLWFDVGTNGDKISYSFYG